jgi:transcriptional regulator with XRE-family HTH domain
MGASKMNVKKPTRNFGDAIRAELEDDPKLAQEVAEEFLHAAIARKVFKLRNDANITQKDLARKLDTTQSVISRIEDADYVGHSLKLLVKLAFAFGKEVAIDFVDPPTPIDPESICQFEIVWQMPWPSAWTITSGNVAAV